MNEALAALHALSAALRGNPAALPLSTRLRLAEGLDGFLCGEMALDEALGLATGPGQRKAATIASIASRDELIRAAAAEFFPDLRPAEQARAMHQLWRRYVAAGWPRERALEDPPERRRGTVEGALWRVMKTRDHLLAERSLRLILAASSGYSLPPPPATFDDDET